MKQIKKMQYLLWGMAGLSALGVASLLAVTANLDSDQLSRFLLVPVVLSGVLLLMCVALFFMAKDMPFGRGGFQGEALNALVVLCVQTGYSALMLSGMASPGIGARSWGEIFAFLGYFCVFILLYRFYQKKKVIEYDGLED